jgi:hypothetical protein
MATAGATEKLCVHCRQDCSAKPRTKDAQGRYMCKECVEKLKAKGARGSSAPPTRAPGAQAAAVAAPPLEESLLSTLLADSPDPCPSCSAPLPKSAVVCNFCGFNKATGQASRTRVMRAPKEKKDKVPGQSALNFSPMWTLGGGVLLLGAAFAGAESGGGLMVGLYCLLFALFWLATAVVTVVYAFIDENVGWAICGIVAIVTGFLWIPTLYYVFAVNEREHVKSMAIATLIGAALFGVLYVQYPDIFQEMNATK